MTSPLRSLLTIIQNSVDEIEGAFEKCGLDFPSIDDDQPNDADAHRLDPSVQAATALLTSAAYQLIARVQLPQAHIFNTLFGYYFPAALRAAMETNVVEILREAGPEGMHVTEIAQKSQIDDRKFEHFVLSGHSSHLSGNHPDVYVNNRLSSVWDTGKSLEEIRQRQVLMISISSPETKFDGTNGIAALIGHCADEDYKGAGQIADHIMAAETAFEDSPERSPLMSGLGYNKGNMWNWFEEPGHEMRLRRFGIAMNGVNSMQPADAILKGAGMFYFSFPLFVHSVAIGFDWGSLPKGSVVVDVGGGIGVSSICIAHAYDHLMLIIQDRPKVLEVGTEKLISRCLELRENTISRRVTAFHDLMRIIDSSSEHDFFKAQPQTSANVFLLKQITHDWSDRYVSLILRQLRDAAAPFTTLVIVDTIIIHPCPSPPSTIPGANLPSPPPPLLANLGAANASTHFADLSMLVHFNAQERTLAHLDKLLADAGWKVTQVHRSDDNGGYLPQIVAIPIPDRCT
ncbi:hypothetical protein D9757_007694 [Collybiopsis confluens]|uniref:O-methyltransferase C-terminal domain-containing protein n=1 Tax=Collybiopsis confluens TaxID=2823264 RepID=A0A8H5H5Q1_9AGAR|nr:hypothetical protein D9757_007694 [Collybiopsis confluens]